MVFDTWGGALSPANYLEFSLAYMQKIVDGVTREANGEAGADRAFHEKWRTVAG